MWMWTSPLAARDQQHGDRRDDDREQRPSRMIRQKRRIIERRGLGRDRAWAWLPFGGAKWDYQAHMRRVREEAA
jgi:hypothetical protein